MTEEVKVEEKTVRKPVSRFLLIEVYDKDGNIITDLKPKNIKIVADCKKPDEDFVFTAQEHQDGVILKI